MATRRAVLAGVAAGAALSLGAGFSVPSFAKGGVPAVPAAAAVRLPLTLATGTPDPGATPGAAVAELRYDGKSTAKLLVNTLDPARFPAGCNVNFTSSVPGLTGTAPLVAAVAPAVGTGAAIVSKTVSSVAGATASIDLTCSTLSGGKVKTTIISHAAWAL